MWSGYLLCVWPSSWSVATSVDMTDVPVLLQSHGKAKRSARRTQLEYTPGVIGSTSIERGACVGLMGSSPESGAHRRLI